MTTRRIRTTVSPSPELDAALETARAEAAAPPVHLMVPFFVRSIGTWNVQTLCGSAGGAGTGTADPSRATCRQCRELIDLTEVQLYGALRQAVTRLRYHEAAERDYDPCRVVRAENAVAAHHRELRRRGLSIPEES
jgi:hypothetical protein